MSNNNKAIGVFDSGLGGLTAVRVLAEMLPSENIVYFGDTARTPYGSHTSDTITKFASEDLAFLLTHELKAVLVACGTVSSTALPALRTMTDVAITGVVLPAAKAAVEATKNKKIAVLATGATVRSKCYETVIKKLCPEALVVQKACPLFVPLVENGYVDRNCKLTGIAADEYIGDILPHGADTVILGCTHYPIIKDIIADRLPGVTIIESGREGARDIKNILTEQNMLSDSKKPGKHTFYVSESPDNFANIAAAFLGEDIRGKVTKIDIDKFAASAGNTGRTTPFFEKKGTKNFV